MLFQIYLRVLQMLHNITKFEKYKKFEILFQVYQVLF